MRRDSATASRTRTASRPEHPDPLHVDLHLLDGFRVTAGRRPVDLSLGSQRLLAFLALMDRAVMRPFVAYTLWSDKTEARATGNLRSALWRIRQVGLGLVEASGSRLRLGRDVHVDLNAAVLLAESVLAGETPSDQAAAMALLTTGDLLVDWYDPWIVADRERLRQLRLHALEALAERSLDAGDISGAIDGALAAIAVEPMRESPHRTLIRAHVEEGNLAEALRQYEAYRYLSYSELGVLPSRHMEAIVQAVRSHRGGGGA